MIWLYGFYDVIALQKLIRLILPENVAHAFKLSNPERVSY